MPENSVSPHFRPQLRALQLQEIEHEGAPYFLFTDAREIAPESLIPAELGPVLALMDGQNTLEQICQQAQHVDPDVTLDWLAEIAGQLDELFLLVSPRFEDEEKRLNTHWKSDPIRPAAFAGRSYPAQEMALRRFLDEKLARGVARLPARAYNPENVRAIVTPHIDFHRGGHTEAASYLPLVENVEKTGVPFDLIVILGVAHAGVRYPFCATNKSFDTPFGLRQSDRDFSRDLLSHIGPQMFAEEDIHKAEHSLEFSAVMLGYHQKLASAKIFAIACGGFWNSLRSGKAPEEDEPHVEEFIAALREVTQKHEQMGRKVGFIASVDGAHVGTQFGDATKISSTKLQKIESEDRAWCAAIERGDKTAFHQHFARDFNRFNVDAHPAVYTLMAAFPEWRGQLLDYDQAFSSEQNIVVSFASMALFEF